MGYKIKGFGWLKDYPSLKDYSAEDAANKIGSKKFKAILEEDQSKVPTSVNNGKWVSPVRDQGNLGSCTAFMATSMYEYMTKRGHSKYVELSPLFTYKSTRWLMHLEGDTGAYIRSALGSLVIHGTVPEEYYPYDIDAFDDNPPALVQTVGQSSQVLKYFRLDKGIPSDQSLVDRMKDYISKGFCLGFGFTVFESIDEATTNGGAIPYPSADEEVLGGHAVMICGYDADNFIIKNSWSEDWGSKGFGTIPTKYFIRQPDMDAPLADDVWAITKYEWLDHGEFGFND